jgi:hypothetical protein
MEISRIIYHNVAKSNFWTQCYFWLGTSTREEKVEALNAEVDS